MAEKNAQSESHLVPVGPLAPGQRWSLARKREVALTGVPQMIGTRGADKV